MGFPFYKLLPMWPSNKGSETADTEAESETAESEEEDAEKESCADREVSPQEESEVTTE